MLEPLFKKKERNSKTGVFLRILQNCSKHVLLWNTPGGCFWICNLHNLVIDRWPNNWSPLKRQIDFLREKIIDSKESHIKVIKWNTIQNVMTKYMDLQSQFWSSYYPFLGTCCYETEKFWVNICFETCEQNVQTANDNRKAISQAL